jgi:N-methylhydantoinase A/oxoprolinase/acetone carboxylase beta subunit
MIAPPYIGENKSDLRGIKPGWYAMNSNGYLVSGPFFSREKCVEKILSPPTSASAVKRPTGEF